MPIRVQCGCGKPLNVRDEMAGKAVKCPGCGQPLRIPGAAAAARPATSAGAAPKTAQARQSAASPSPASPSSASPSPARAVRPFPGAAKPVAAKAANSLDDLFAEEGLTRNVAAVCPACRSEMNGGATLCTKCGFNIQTGLKMTGHQVAGVDIDMGTVALQKAERDMARDERLQKTMTAKAGMPPWMLALVLFILGSATLIAVIAVNASKREETINFNPLQMFLQLGGMAFGLVGLGALLSIIGQAFRSSRNEGLYSLSIVYLLYFVPTHMRTALRPAILSIFCGAIAGVFFWGSTRV